MTVEILAWCGRNAKRAAVATLGAILLVAGALLLVLPGPGLLVMVAGLAVLGTEFAWARRAMHATRARAATAGRAARRLGRGRPPAA